MGYSESVSSCCPKKKAVNKRRSFIPEPPSCPIVEPPVFQVAFSEEMPKKKHHRSRTIRAQITHTSCLTAIRNYVINMQRPKKRKHKKRKSCPDNAQKIISSLKNDIQVISKYQQDTVCNPEKIGSTDPFFILSAMMCKINKLEDLIIRSTECERQMSKRRDMLITANCIKKSLVEQMHCDEELLKEKHKKLCYLVKSLDMFEKQIRCMTKAIKYKCSTPKRTHSPQRSKTCVCDCPDKRNCSMNCPERKQAYPEPAIKSTPPPLTPSIPSKSENLPSPCHPCQPSCRAPCSLPEQRETPQADSSQNKDPCRSIDFCDEKRGKYDITGMNLTYTKSSVHGDSKGKETEQVQNKICYSLNENEDCRVTLIKDGAQCQLDPSENVELKAKLNNVSKMWLESARQLMDAFCA